VLSTAAVLFTAKHGFYWRQYHQDEHADLEHLDQRQSLNDEISLLRVMMRRLLIQSEGLEDVQDTVRVLRSLSVCAGRMAELLRTQQRLKDSLSAGEAEQAFTVALHKVMEEYQDWRDQQETASPADRPASPCRPKKKSSRP